MSRPAIETIGLQREFKGGLKAVQGIDLAVAPGEVYGFLGPNGAGKTTTVRMLVTLLRPTGGRATIAGFDVATQPAEVRRRIGVALQEAALDLLMTGRELMELQATLHGIPRRAVARRADQLIERVGLAQAAGRRVGTYSGGMRRRLDLAMALIHEPEVLFLDEPTTGLDPTSRMTLWDEVRRLRDEGTTVFLTTQYLEEADVLADRVGIIDSGVLVAEGTPAALKAQVGAPHLDITLGGERPDVEAARSAIGPLGELLAHGAGAGGTHLSLRVVEGAAAIAPVVRALDDAGCVVEGIEVVRPTLDDVFAEQTGHHLEGAAAGEPVEPAVPS
ncbi:MAG TPA: ATP-binding cassette domain-containing protein [Baekduia sp.]|nr:ATP-binding cassette domain-containing protein [Baekduia sp.]HMJ37564.1 ATP-binding cassette domain-containing protein [Baekduia sp.]